jgi:hypothetical protein
MAKKPLPRSDIQIRLNREELRRLVQMVYIATWVIESHSAPEDPRAAPYEALEQKVYVVAARHGFAGETGDPAEDLLAYYEEPKKFVPTIDLDEGEAGAFIIEYDEDVFWDELAYRLAERDAVQEAGGYERYAALPVMARFDLASRYELMYGKEFEEHGLENVRIVRPPASRHAVH